MRHRVDPLTLAGVMVGGALVVLTGLLVTQPGDARAWTLPAPVAVVPDEPMPEISAEGMQRVDTAEVVVPIPRASRTWVAQIAAATEIPPVALAAYADATLALEAEQPACRLGWTTLAAIGGLESGHGTHGGAVLGADGRSTPPIVGPALDGVGFAAIPATPESTAWHGDAAWDHAIGPMQFLPSSWERWAADGDGDGVADPHDLDDAALAAARYLCADGGDLSTASGWRAAVLSYNRSEDYLAAVLATADGYALASGG